MADVVGHPWMKGPMATPEEVQNEFRNRHEKILMSQKQEEERRNAIRADRMARATNNTYRGEASNQVLLSAAGEEEGQQL